MTVKDTGNAKAAGDETAVTGYRGPAPGNGREPIASVKLAGTGDAIASGGISNTGYGPSPLILDTGDSGS
ncbi:hypothetical protein [Streptomyces sp. NPDC102437]|uniref:hypothetical protein n=1 Tax=Streptomyces sp. NPDC102437 TaxID=3366175 RepID=UPI0037F73E23